MINKSKLKITIEVIIHKDQAQAIPEEPHIINLFIKRIAIEGLNIMVNLLILH